MKHPVRITPGIPNKVGRPLPPLRAQITPSPLWLSAAAVLLPLSVAAAWELVELPSPDAAAGNVITDGSFEGNDWDTAGGAALAGSARTGKQAGRVERADDKTDPRLIGTFGPVGAGKWLLSAWLRSSLPPSADRNYAAVLDVTWVDAAGKDMEQSPGLYLNGRVSLWQCREALVTAPPGAVQVRLTFRFSFSVAGWAEVDDVCLTPAAGDATSAPGAALPLAVRPARSLFAPDEPIRVAVTLPAEQRAPATLTGVLLDSRGRQLASSAPVSVAEPDKQREAEVVFQPDGVPANEWLQARLTATSGQSDMLGVVGARHEVGVLVRPRPTEFRTEADSPFALLEGHPYTQRWLGARWQRPNFSWNERAYELGNRYGVTTLAMINQASEALHERVPMEEYAQYVEDSVRKLKGLVRWWQLGNEPPLFQPGMAERYAAVCKAGYEAAKRADPNCVVSMAGLTGLDVDPNMLAKFLDAGGAQWCDVIDLHLYVDIPTMDRLLTKIRADMAARHVDKPIILTEVTASLGQVLPEREKAGHVYKRYALALSHGVKQLYWFVTHWVNDLPGGFRHCGLIDVKNYAPWPAAAAYGRLSDALTGAKFERRVITDDGGWLFEFSKADRRYWVLWAEQGEPRPLELVCGEGTARLIDVAGHEWSVEVNGELTVTLTEEPLLLDLPAPEVATDPTSGAAQIEPARVTLARGGTAALNAHPESLDFDAPLGLQIEGSSLRAAPEAAVEGAVLWAFAREGATTSAALRLPVSVAEPLAATLSPLPSTDGSPAAVRVGVSNLSAQVQRGTLTVTSPVASGLRPAVLRRGFTDLKPEETAHVDLQVPAATDPLGRYPFRLEVTTEGGVEVCLRRTLVFLAARRCAKPPKIDGSLDEWGTGFPIRIGIDSGERSDPKDGPPASDTDLCPEAQVQWDAAALYLAVRVRDDIHRNDQKDGALWDGDGLQFSFAPQPDTADAPRAEFGCALTTTGPQAWAWQAFPRAPTGPVQFPLAIKRLDAETLYEMAVPWAMLPGIEPRPGAWFGFSLLVDEQDTAGRGYYGWHGGVSEPKDPAQLGQVTLMGGS